MRGAVIHGPGDVRFEELDDAKIVQPTDAVIRTVATCVCGSDLWPYRGLESIGDPHPMGHEYVGIVEEVGREVTAIEPGQFVVGSFSTSDNTCPNCLAGWQSNCLNRQFNEYLPGGVRPHRQRPRHPRRHRRPPGRRVRAQSARRLRRDGHRLVRRPRRRGTAGFTSVVVGDGAVGLCGIIAAKELGTEHITTMRRHASCQKLALEFGATDIISERGEVGIGLVKELTNGIGADAVLERVGTPRPCDRHCARPGPAATSASSASRTRSSSTAPCPVPTEAPTSCPSACTTCTRTGPASATTPNPCPTETRTTP